MGRWGDDWSSGYTIVTNLLSSRSNVWSLMIRLCTTLNEKCAEAVRPSTYKEEEEEEEEEKEVCSLVTYLVSRYIVTYPF